jgi:DMSO/TMAO reductase YedYZ molybdopterin-dependent catalytic subunit/mono/diheme cytochrome c family protein
MSDEKRRGRRAFLRTSVLGGAAVVAACGADEERAPEATPEPTPGPEPTPAASTDAGLPDGLDPRNFVVHGLEPLTLETRRDRFGTSVVTPASLFFVRNNLPLPPLSIVDRPNDWSLEVQGVGEARSVTVRELKQWGVETTATVVQCSGNGRQFFEHEASGSQWGVGAAACAVWSGVPLKTVVERLGGVTEGMRFLTSTGGEELPEGVDRDSVVVERSIPVAKALDDCLLAWEMNGAPIPITHGGPLRLIVPGYFGCNQIKYVKRIAFTESETTANIMRSGYRFRPIGESGSPEQPSMWQMDIKSWINGPSGMHPVARGPVQVHGVAFSGGRGVSAVEVSTDGQSWQEAELLGPDLGPYAWRQFKVSMELDLGEHQLFSRARDGEGNVQPESRVENHRGYGHNGWRDMGVTFEVVEGPVIIEEESVDGTLVAEGPAPGSLELSADESAGRQLFTSDAAPSCGTCHTLSEAGTEGTVGPNLNALAPSEEQIAAAVSNGVGAMPAYGDRLSDAQIQQIAAYVKRVVSEGR